MIWLIAIFLLAASPASAEPFSALVISGLGITSTLGVAFVRLGVGLALSQLSRVVSGRRSGVADPGIQPTVTTAGGINSQTIMLGTYITSGNMICSPMSHGRSVNSLAPDTPNGVHTYVMDLADVELTSLKEVHVDDTVMKYPDNFEVTMSGDLGYKCKDGRYAGKLFIDPMLSGNTAVNPRLLALYGGRTERPWLSDMQGRGMSYVALHFIYDREVYQSEPRVKFVVDSTKLYDPRKDSTVGGSGSHRWGQANTYEFTENAMVMVYNILRGITVRSDLTYGIGVAAADLPLDIWAAAMNACGFFEYRAGMEINIAEDEPLAVIDELLKSCDGDIADVGGIWLARVGPPALPIAFITDDDVLRNRPQEMDPFPSLNDTYNGVHVSYRSKDAKWEPKDAPPRYDLNAEAADGRRLIADVSLPAVTGITQAQRLGRAWLLDARRMRRHTIVLGPEGLLINPLDTVQWTSVRNGYTNKLFEISERVIDPRGLSCTFAMRERNPTDYDWSPSDELPTSVPSSVRVSPAAQTVPNFAVAPLQVNDDSGARRPALRLTWTGDLPDVRAVRWQVRNKATQQVVAAGSTHSVSDLEVVVTGGILPNVVHEARAILVADRPVSWTSWLTVTSPNIRFVGQDITPLSIGSSEITDNAAAIRIYAENTATTAVNTGDGWVSIVQLFLNRVAGSPTEVAITVTLRPASNVPSTLFNIRVTRAGTPFKSYGSAILKPDSASAIFTQTYTMRAIDPFTGGGNTNYTVQIDALNFGLFCDFALLEATQGIK